MRLTALAAFFAAALALVPSATAASPISFRLPSGNIGCIYADASITGRAFLRCDTRFGLRPEPRARCEQDWTGIVFPAASKPRPQCAGDTALDSRARVIPYGGRWVGGGYICTSSRTGLRCKRRNGHGFFLSRTSWRVY
ncbi:MAG: hypothetical protein M3540_02615 [Actinomycetota bacterium]|nr:hypothetical protein [Actinomycetota bacterium]